MWRASLLFLAARWQMSQDCHHQSELLWLHLSRWCLCRSQVWQADGGEPDNWHGACFLPFPLPAQVAIGWSL